MIRAGIQDWWFCSNGTCTQPNRIPSLGGTLWTRLFLERWTRDWRKAGELRRILTEADRGRSLLQLTDDEVVAQVALLIERGCIHIHASHAWVHVEDKFSQSGVTAPPQPPAFPLASRSAQSNPESAAPAPDDPATFTGPVDPGAMVAALMAAASQGAPFCPQ
jgi:hypothetical protein